MRIVALSEGDQESLDHLFIRLLVDVLEKLIVPLGNDLGGGIERMLVEALLQKFRLDPIGPEPVRLLGGGRPRCLFPVDLDGLAALEVMRSLGKCLVLGDTLLDPLPESRENLTGGVEITAGYLRGQGRRKAVHEFVHVILGEVEMHVIEHLEIVLKHAFRHGLRILGFQAGRVLLR